MSSDFYLKAQTLYKDFQNKELHYLNTERKLNDSLMWKKNLNVPLKEYFEKIHQREKKNEEIYLDIMKQMSELDHRTDLLCSKIEKLGIFRNIQFGNSLHETNYPLTSRYIPEIPSTVNKFNTEISVPSIQLDNLKSAFTQTEATIYCDNCKSIVQVSSQMFQIQNSTSSFIDILSVSKDEPKINDSLRLQPDSFFSKNDEDTQFISAALNTEKFEAKNHDDNLSLEREPDSSKSNEVLFSKNVKNSENKVLPESFAKADDSEINVEVSMTKNDTDSVNHEFDFLESEVIHQPISKNNVVQQNTKNIDQATNSDVMYSNKIALKLKKKGTFQTDKTQEISDNKSDISGSISGARSPIASVSDSDSVSEKGSFTASAAYQSLLGNATVSSKINRRNSDSESEDEVEKTLAHSVQKSNIKMKSSVQTQKDKSISQSSDSKPITNKPKPISLNKPQSKLSKSTKKVLGIDSSSSSEIETAVKPPENKKDEDSDEFDFYD